MATTSMISLSLFIALFVFRYLRTIISIFAWNLNKPTLMATKPRYTSKDATVIIPTTFKTPHELVNCVRRILQNNPYAVFIVTASANVPLVLDTCAASAFPLDKIKVLGVDKLNKRNQILKAMPEVQTPITILADDDVFWPDNFTEHMLAIFEDPKVGAGGPRQRVQRNEKPDFWNFLGISYLERRVWNNCATNAIDGSISTLSGRTALYRTDILKCEEFYYYFTHDTWCGKPLNSDDDKCLTRYVYSHGWQIKLQFDERATIETTVEGDQKYLDQCMRWARAHWRGNFIVMMNESYWYSWKFLWGFYYIYIGQFQSPAFLVEGLLWLFLWMALGSSTSSTARNAYIALACWIVFTKNLKMIPHFRRHPSDMKFIPVGIAFSYYHGFMNIWAAFSMKQTHWGSQNLTALAETRVEKEEEIPFLKETMEEADGFREPTSGRIMEGDDYFSAIPAEKEDVVVASYTDLAEKDVAVAPYSDSGYDSFSATSSPFNSANEMSPVPTPAWKI